MSVSSRIRALRMHEALDLEWYSANLVADCAAMRRPSIPKLKRSPAAPQPTGPGAPVVPVPVPTPKPSRRRPPLRMIVVAVVAILAIVLLVRACGGDDEAEVRETVERFGQAVSDKDYQTLCDDLLANALVSDTRSAGQPCEVALRTGLGERKEPKLKIDSVKVEDDTALVETHSTAAGERPSRDTVRLIKEDGDWRISNLVNEAPPDPTP